MMMTMKSRVEGEEKVKEIVNRVKRLRLRLKLTQDQMAKKLGVSKKSIGRWETGAHEPHPVFLKQMEKM